MPFTPFHMGPAIVIKAAAGERFSLAVFGVAQIAIDIEPLIRLIRNDDITHGFMHTYIGGLAVGLAVAVLAKPICPPLIKIGNAVASLFGLAWLKEPSPISWPVVFSSALIGTISHVFLDSMMHADTHPLAPFSSDQTMLDAMSRDNIYLMCMVAGLAGSLAWLVRKWAFRRNS